MSNQYPPSVKLQSPLIDSYSYHSVDLIAGTSEDIIEKALETAKVDTWMLGVDEAGRGPVLGPQVYGISFCRTSYSEDLRSLGFADSKTLTAESREQLLDVMMAHSEDVKWAVRVMSPHDISRGMLRKNPYNLNAQSHDATIKLIRDTLNRGYNVTECFVDTVGPADAYKIKLQAEFPTLSFVVCSKADSIYPIVSAASIAAKVTRDKVMEAWTFLEKDLEDSEETTNFGSGYPSDPKTVAWLENNVDSIFGFANIARFSWQTVKTILVKRGTSVKWDDEPSGIQKYFSGANPEPTQTPLWKDLSLVSVGGF